MLRRRGCAVIKAEKEKRLEKGKSPDGPEKSGGGKPEVSGLKKIRRHVLACEHKDCLKRGGKESLKELKQALKDAGQRERVLITKVDCLDQCDDGPVMVVYPEGVWYGEVDGPCAREIAAKLLSGGVAEGCRILHDMRDGAGREE